MTFAAALIADHFEMAVLGRLDSVSRMAIGANRTSFVAPGQELAVDTGVVNLFDLDVAFAASLGDVRGIDWRVTVHGALDVMNAMAIVAGGGDDQSHFEQRPAMNAVLVLGGSLRVLHLVLLRESRIAVAVGAGARQIQFEDGRVGVFGVQDVVRSVATPATGGAGSAEGVADAVNAGRVIFRGLLVVRFGLMAANAGRRRKLVRMNEVFDTRVAINAIEFGVDGFLKAVGGKDQRDNFAIYLAGGGGIEVAIEAIGVGELFGGAEGEDQG